MNIDKAHIKNFKCLKDTCISLGNLTLITGINSSGKSSFIQSLLLLKQNTESIQKFIVFNSFLNDKKDEEVPVHLNDLLKNIPPFILDGQYITLGEGKSLLYQEAFNENISLNLRYSNGQFVTVCFDTDARFSVEHNDASNKFTLNILNNFYYIRTDRAIPSITYPLSELHVRSGHVGLNGEYAAHYLSLNRHQKLSIGKLKHPNSTTEQLLENVSKWLGEISSGIDISVTVHEQLQIASLTYQYVYGGETTGQYTPLNVGFGITYVLPVIVALLKSKPGDLLIIENPESHLHPAGQSKIAELCAIAAHNGVQIIIESHSDHLLNGLRVATKDKIIKPEESKIYYFRKVDDRLDTVADAINIDKDGNLDDYPKGFFDEWDNNIDKLLGL